MIKKKNLSKEDKNTWENYIKNPLDIYDKDKNVSRDINSGKRFKFDLHGFTLQDANNKIKNLVLSCVERNYKEILLLTGKGNHSTNDRDVYSSKELGKLRFSVPEFIISDPELSKFIISINKADIKDGGEGAILIRLKNL